MSKIYKFPSVYFCVSAVALFFAPTSSLVAINILADADRSSNLGEIYEYLFELWIVSTAALIYTAQQWRNFPTIGALVSGARFFTVINMLLCAFLCLFFMIMSLPLLLAVAGSGGEALWYMWPFFTSIFVLAWCYYKMK